MAFDGQGSYVSVPNYPGLPLTGAITISAWARGVACDECDGSLAGIVAKGNIVPFGINVDDGDRMLFRVVSGGAWWDVYAYDQSIEGEAWYHYAGVFAPDEYVRLYLDGDVVAEVRDNVPEVIDASSLDTWIGTRAHSVQPSVPLYFFQGAIDDVRIYERALTSQEVRALSDDR